jgi:hypothetical protein
MVINIRAYSTHGGDRERERERRNSYKILVGTPEGKRLIGRIRLVWRTILERILGKQREKLWIGCIWLRIGTSGMLL